MDKRFFIFRNEKTNKKCRVQQEKIIFNIYLEFQEQGIYKVMFNKVISTGSKNRIFVKALMIFP
jgi:hypothetical protein